MELWNTVTIDNLQDSTEPWQQRLTAIQQSLETLLDQEGCPMAQKFQVLVAVEEMFTNIAKYAYLNQKGAGKPWVEVSWKLEKNPTGLTLRLTDQGTPYNPLDAAVAHLSAPLEEKEIGGLGIYLVKKTMDRMDYTYQNGKNIVTLFKAFS